MRISLFFFLKIYKCKKRKIVNRSDGGGSWSANLLTRYNQDNQRDFEEKAAAQMITMLTKRILFQNGLMSKTYQHGKLHGYYWNIYAPIGIRKLKETFNIQKIYTSVKFTF